MRREGGLAEISAFREYAPGQRVQARIEVSGPGLFRRRGGRDRRDGRRDAGRLRRASIRKQPLGAACDDDAFDASAQALRRLTSSRRERRGRAAGAAPARRRAADQVFVNGVEQAEGDDYSIHGSEIVFARPIVKERVSGGALAGDAIGLFGSYGKHETVDVHYRRGGKTEVASDAEVLPADPRR